MLHQPAGASSKTGGGDDMMATGGRGGHRCRSRAAGRSRSRCSPACCRSARRQGRRFLFKVPTYRGELRIMAITAGPTKIGRAEAKVTVKDPLVIQVTFPRFVTQGDEMQIPVFMTTSGGPLEVRSARHTVIPIAGLAQPKTAAAPLRSRARTTARSRSRTASPRRSCSGEGKHAGRRREAARRREGEGQGRCVRGRR